ncbi:MAG TPA: biotin--[acetyl-CoA-carboxylase] ligase [Solirubrobacterales bacterium]|nr:biotin--[acetyl-CoA-carboxylase] ligase [Solirubrobacterales bacterium]
MSFGAPHRHYRAIDSTNARARELVEDGAPHGTVVTADEQTAGRGRQGRTWTAPPGKSLLYSAILRPLDERHLLLPLAVPLAVCEAAEELQPGIECCIKWPNDIWIEERKLAGVLIEAKPQDGWAVIGVGLNLTIAREEFPPELQDTATSLFGWSLGSRGEGWEMPREAAHRREIPAAKPLQHSERSASEANLGTFPVLPSTPRAATAALNRHLDHWVTTDRDEILASWRARDALRGREISWDGGGGVADGIEDSGDLVVVAGGGDRVVLGAGEVHLRL